MRGCSQRPAQVRFTRRFRETAGRLQGDRGGRHRAEEFSSRRGVSMAYPETITALAFESAHVRCRRSTLHRLRGDLGRRWRMPCESASASSRPPLCSSAIRRNPTPRNVRCCRHMSLLPDESKIDYSGCQAGGSLAGKLSARVLSISLSLRCSGLHSSITCLRKKRDRAVESIGPPTC